MNFKENVHILLNHICTILFHLFSTSSSTCHLSWVMVWSFRELNFFLLREFCCHTMAQVSMVFVGGHRDQAASISIRFAKRCEVWRCPDGTPFRLNIPDDFHQMLAFIGPVGKSNCLNPIQNFVERVQNKNKPVSFSLDADCFFLNFLIYFSLPFQKWSIYFFAFEQRIADWNAAYSFYSVKSPDV